MLGGVLRSLWSSVYFVFLPSICISSGLCLGVIRTAAGSHLPKGAVRLCCHVFSGFHIYLSLLLFQVRVQI